jgi:hypothetical protein
MSVPVLVCLSLALASAGACELKSGPSAPVVVELYTSEGCDSCPPADRWLSSLKGRAGVVALAFHVDYWDRLGWTDRFASPAFTERQAMLRSSSGAPFAYTPQVLVGGADWRRWPGALPAPAASAVDLALRRDGARVEARIAPRAGAPLRLAGYWAVVEDGHVSAVKAGENSGVTLRHDHVVRQYEPVPAWSGVTQRTLVFDAPPAAPGRRVVLVVTDARTNRPLQALSIDC